MDSYRKRVNLEIGGVQAKIEMTFTRVIPKINPPASKDLALDFAFTIGEVLGLGRGEWRALKLPMSQSIPRYVVEQLLRDGRPSAPVAVTRGNSSIAAPARAGT